MEESDKRVFISRPEGLTPLKITTIGGVATAAFILNESQPAFAQEEPADEEICSYGYDPLYFGDTNNNGQKEASEYSCHFDHWDCSQHYLIPAILREAALPSIDPDYRRNLEHGFDAVTCHDDPTPTLEAYIPWIEYAPWITQVFIDHSALLEGELRENPHLRNEPWALFLREVQPATEATATPDETGTNQEESQPATEATATPEETGTNQEESQPTAEATATPEETGTNQEESQPAIEATATPEETGTNQEESQPATEATATPEETGTNQEESQPTAEATATPEETGTNQEESQPAIEATATPEETGTNQEESQPATEATATPEETGTNQEESQPTAEATATPDETGTNQEESQPTAEATATPDETGTNQEESQPATEATATPDETGTNQEDTSVSELRSELPYQEADGYNTEIIVGGALLAGALATAALLKYLKQRRSSLPSER